MIQQELEWVKNNVKNQTDNEATGIRDVDDCQPFVMTAPGPGHEGQAKFKQRALGSVFFCSCASRIYRFEIDTQLLGIRTHKRRRFALCSSLTIRSILDQWWRNQRYRMLMLLGNHLVRFEKAAIWKRISSQTVLLLM
jgi:hypothetical protein